MISSQIPLLLSHMTSSERLDLGEEVFLHARPSVRVFRQDSEPSVRSDLVDAGSRPLQATGGSKMKFLSRQVHSLT